MLNNVLGRVITSVSTFSVSFIFVFYKSCIADILTNKLEFQSTMYSVVRVHTMTIMSHLQSHVKMYMDFETFIISVRKLHELPFILCYEFSAINQNVMVVSIYAHF
jgi:hypothetical protein